MKRNSNFITSTEIGISKTSCSGIHDTFDNYNTRVLDNWPPTLRIESVTNSSGNQTENTLYSHTVTSTGLLADETLYWKVVYADATTSTDFYSGIVQGTFTQSASTQTGSFDIEHDFIGDPNKSTRTYTFQVLRGGYSGDVLYESNSITITKPTLGNISWISSPVNEGSSANLNFYLTNCGTYRTRTLTLTNTGTASAADFSSLPTTRSQNPASSTNVTYTTLNDLTTEGSETLTVAISYGGYSSWGSSSLTINDTSVYPSISSVTPSTTNVTEGDTVTFTVTDSTSSTGTLYWTINTSGGVSAADFSPATLSGSFTLTSGSGTIDITPIVEGSTESETFTLEIRYGSTSGTILATSTTVTITDSAAAAPGGAVFTTTGSHSWTVPAGVTIVHVVCVGGGGGSHTGYANLSYNGANGAGGGGLAYGNNIPVTPGSSISINVGAGGTALNNQANTTAGAGGDSWFSSSAYLNGGGGDPATYTSATTSNLPNALGGTSTGTARSGGGSGGNGGVLTADGTGGGGGGGAGGYSGNGGNGGGVTSSTTGSNGTAGSGGGGGGGGSSYNPAYGGASGGGVGIYGLGSNGSAGISGTAASSAGGGGSGGNDGQLKGNGTGTGGTYGGGGAGGGDNPGGASNSAAATGAQGAVRVIWGAGRAFPSTNADLASSTSGETTY